MDKSQYRDLFVSEAKEHISLLNNALVIAEKDPSNQEAIAEIFRAVHSIKGAAATMEYQSIVELTHRMEDYLGMVRDGKAKLTTSAVDVLFACLDALELLVEEKEVPGLSMLLEKVERLKIGGVEGAPKSVERWMVKFSLSPDTQLALARAVVIVAQLQGLMKVEEVIPDLSSVDEDDFSGTVELVVETAEPGEIKKFLAEFSEVVDVEVTKLSAGRSTTVMPSYLRRSGDIRVKLGKLDKIQNLVAELVVAKEHLLKLGRHYVEEELVESVNRFAGVISELEDEIMAVRMVPIGQVFGRFPRYVRETSLAMGKEVEFVMEGMEIELDRSLLDNLVDPILHILRNAIDHGLENPEERLRSGKPRVGLIKLSAKRVRNAVVIEVSDDGRGVDEERVREAAIKRGVISSEEAEVLDREDILKLIFETGFSTSGEVTEVSGRGVGLDVVKATLRALGGNVDIMTEKGKGTTFVLSVPLTMAIIRAFLVKTRGEVYAVPLTYLAETVDVDVKDIKKVLRREVIILRDQVLPVVRLGNVFGLEGEENGHKAELPALVVDIESKRACIVVDELMEQTDIVVKNLTGIISNIKEFAGVTILGDGNPALIIDVPNIL